MAKIDPTEEDIQFFDMAESLGQFEAPGDEPSEQRSKKRKKGGVPSAILRGLLKGTQQFGRAFGPLQDTGIGNGNVDEQFNEMLESLLPVKESPFSRVGERTAEIFPSLVTLPFGSPGAGEALSRSFLAASSREGAKQGGLGELGQALAEVPSLVSPNVFTGKLQPNESQREFVEFSRRLGATDEQIAPLLSAEGDLTGPIAKFARKGKKGQRALDSSQELKDFALQRLQAHPGAVEKLNSQQFTNLVEGLESKLSKLSVDNRSKILADVEEFMGSERTLGDLENLWRDINEVFGGKGKRIQTLKGPILEAMEAVSPEFAKDFQLTNDLASKWFKINNAFNYTNRDTVEAISGLTEAAGLLFGITTGNVPQIASIVGIEAARRIGREMLINPKFQNIGKKFATAISKGSVRLAQSAKNEFARQMELAGLEEDLVSQLRGIGSDDFRELIELNQIENESQ